MDRLDYHNRIIDNNSNSQKQSKQSEKINAESEQVQEEKSTDNSHRDRNCRNERRAKILQEKINNNKYKYKCLQKGSQNLFN